jgi:hypothetical protein
LAEKSSERLYPPHAYLKHPRVERSRPFAVCLYPGKISPSGGVSAIGLALLYCGPAGHGDQGAVGEVGVRLLRLVERQFDAAQALGRAV